MQAPRGGGFLGKRKDWGHNYPSSSMSSSHSQQGVRFAPPPPPPFLSKPDPRAREQGHPAVPRPGTKPALHPPPPAGKGSRGNLLLAGYLAHEFLTYGTIHSEPRLAPPPIQKEKELAAPEPSKRYAEVSRLLMAGGASIPGIVNPSQLGGWLKIKDKE